MTEIARLPMNLRVKPERLSPEGYHYGGGSPEVVDDNGNVYAKVWRFMSPIRKGQDRKALKLAHLFAASPKLLAACEAVLNEANLQLDADDLESQRAEISPKTLRLIAAAIATAQPARG